MMNLANWMLKLEKAYTNFKIKFKQMINWLKKLWKKLILV